MRRQTASGAGPSGRANSANPTRFRDGVIFAVVVIAVAPFVALAGLRLLQPTQAFHSGDAHDSRRMAGMEGLPDVSKGRCLGGAQTRP